MRQQELQAAKRSGVEQAVALRQQLAYQLVPVFGSVWALATNTTCAARAPTSS